MFRFSISGPKKAAFHVKNEWLHLPGACPRYRAGGLAGRVQQNSEDAMRASPPHTSNRRFFHFIGWYSRVILSYFANFNLMASKEKKSFKGMSCVFLNKRRLETDCTRRKARVYFWAFRWKAQRSWCKSLNVKLMFGSLKMQGRQGNLRNEEPVLFLGQLCRQNSRVYVPDHAFLNTDFAIWDVFLQAKGDLSPAEALWTACLYMFVRSCRPTFLGEIHPNTLKWLLIQYL